MPPMREVLRAYWQIPAAVLVSGVAIMMNTPTVIEGPVLPAPEPDLVEAWVLMQPVNTGDRLTPEMVQKVAYPVAWMPSDAVSVDTEIWVDQPLIRQPLPIGTPMAAHMLDPNPRAQISLQLNSSDLMLRMPTEMAQSVPQQLPPDAHATFVFESQTGDQDGVILSAIPVSVTDPDSLQRTLWLHLSKEQLRMLERGRRLGRLHLGLCARSQCPSVTLKTIADPAQQPKQAAPKRAVVTVGLS